MNTNSTKLKQLFNKLAKHYYFVDFLSFGFSNYLRKIAIKDGFTSTHVKVVDLMCGSGNNLRIIQNNKFSFLSYSGFDFSPQMIQVAKKKFVLKDNEQFFELDLIHGQTNNIHADYIICTYGLKCISIKDYDKFVTLLHHVLNKNGSFVLLDIQLPTSSFLKVLSIFYLLTIGKMASKIITGNVDAAKGLLLHLETPIDFKKLKFLLAEKGIEILIEKKYSDSIIIINGKLNATSFNAIV